METEKRSLIDRNRLLRDPYFQEDRYPESHLLRMAITEQPTVDAVEVVRCKDCKWAEYGKACEPYCNHWKSGLYADIKDDDFCSYGERRHDNA